MNNTQNKWDRNFRCKECEDFGQYQIECPSFFKRKNKEFLAILSNDESVTSSDLDDEICALDGCNST